MRLLYCLQLVVIAALSCKGQTIFNAHQISGPQNDFIASHTIDPLGNKYLNIYTRGGELTIYGKTYSINAGNHILRFDASDSLTMIYDLEFTGPTKDDVQAMEADIFGNLYLASKYHDGRYNNFRYTKLSPDGTVLWQVNQYIDASVESKKILIDDEGNTYVCGYIESVLFFGVRLYQSIVYPYHDFLLKFSPTGELIWIHTSDASDNDLYTASMRFDNQGNVILAGMFYYDIKMGSFSLSGTYGLNMYLASISPSGEVQWLKGFAGLGETILYDIEVDPGGNFYFSGSFRGIGIFGDIIFDYPGQPNFMLGKLSSDFDIEWIKFDQDNINPGPFNIGGYLAKTPDGVLVSGTAYGGFQMDDLALPPADNLQAFVAKVTSEGTTSWLKGYGDALIPGSYEDGPFFFRAGYQLSRITDECYFVSGNFVNTLTTYDGIVTTQSRDAFTGIFSDTPYTSIDLGPDISLDLCQKDTDTLSLNLTLGINNFIIVQGTMPTITSIDDTNVRISKIAYGVTKFKWVVQNCTSISSKLITINRIDPNFPQVTSETNFCTLTLNDAIVSVSGSNVSWFDDEMLTNKIESGNTYIPSVSDTLYVISEINECASDPAQIIIVVIDSPQPPSGEPMQTLGSNETIADLIVSGNNIKWYTALGDELSPTALLKNDSTYFATQTVSGCESNKLPIKVSLVTDIEDDDLGLVYYPNPVNDKLIITFGQPIDQIVVKNSLGQIVIRNDNDSNTTELGLASLGSGVFFVQVRSNEKMLIFRIVKE